MRRFLYRNLLLVPLLAALCLWGCRQKPHPGEEEPFAQPEWIKGADLSLLPTFEQAGAVYCNGEGTPVAVLPFFREKGFNYVRVRLFVDPDPASTACQDLPYVLSLIQRAQAEGYYVLLDFHYSDTWADPGKQYLPQSWAQTDSLELPNQLAQYTKDVLKVLVHNGATPEMIQIGNEITCGLLWDKGRVDLWQKAWNTEPRWAYFCQLLKAASQACREVCPRSALMLHIDRGGNRQDALDFFQKIDRYGVNYDLIGLSYYPFWHGTLSDLRNTLTGLLTTYPSKKVNIVEVAFPIHPWGVPQDAIPMQYPASIEGQRAFMADFEATLHQFPNVNGYMYWFPEETYSPHKDILTLHRGLFDNKTGRYTLD